MAFIALLAGLLLQSPADWPGLWGPSRNGHAAGGLDGTPRGISEVWRRPTSGGYSEIAVAGDLAVTLELRGGRDFVLALEAATGRERWSTEIGPTYRGHDGSDDGPISTPTIAGNEIYAVGPHGHFLALDAATGRVRWRHDLVAEFNAVVPQWGFASSPLVDGSLVILPTGGPSSRGVLAFRRSDGTLAWSAPHTNMPTYSSAVPATLGGIRQIVVASSDRIFGMAPADGRLLWSVAGPGPSEQISNSPMVLPGNRVLVSLFPEAWMLKVARSGDRLVATVSWKSTRPRAYNGPSIFHDGFLYGFAGESLTCLDPETGGVRWQHRTGAGSLVGAGRHLLVLDQASGQLRVVLPTPQRYAEVFSAAVLAPEVRAVTGPTLAGGRIFVRNLKEMAAFVFSQ